MSASRGNRVAFLGVGLEPDVFDGFRKFQHKLLLEDKNYPVLNMLQKKEGQINKVEGGMACTNLESDVLGVG